MSGSQPLVNYGEALRLEVPDSALKAGFLNEPIGTHGSRTIMLRELSRLMAACGPGASPEDYREAIVEQNVLVKATLSTRKESLRRLRELYGLSDEILLFRALRDLWSMDPAAQPLLGLLCSCARDPILRATADLILRTDKGAEMTPSMISDAVRDSFPGRYGPMMLANVGRHVASSWQQSGHLAGRLRKTRARALNTPIATTYALFLAYLCNGRGDSLFRTAWARLLDAPEHETREYAAVASRQGWLEYREMGGVTEVTFRHLLRGREKP
jgi:hypothetical protein